MIALSPRVIAPFRVRAWPWRLAPVMPVIDVRAMMVPDTAEPAPRVTVLPTCQKMLAARAPPVRTTWLPDAVTSVEPIWKIKTPLGLPWASRVSVPVIASEEAAL
jgi:hypothetical protein